MKKSYLTRMSVLLILVLVFSTTAFAHHGNGQGCGRRGNSTQSASQYCQGTCTVIDCPYGEMCPGNGTCPYGQDCPNYGNCSNPEECPRWGLAAEDTECANDLMPAKGRRGCGQINRIVGSNRCRVR